MLVWVVSHVRVELGCLFPFAWLFALPLLSSRSRCRDSSVTAINLPATLREMDNHLAVTPNMEGTGIIGIETAVIDPIGNMPSDLRFFDHSLGC